MDFSRRPYTTLCKFNRNSAVASKVVWYVVPKGTPCLQPASCITVMDWDKEPYQSQDVGEVWQAPKVYNGHLKPLLGADGSHRCGTDEDWLKGGLRDESLPPVEYATSGLPKCCNPVATVEGGGAAGGKSPVAWIPPAPIPGTSCVDAGLLPTTEGNYTGHFDGFGYGWFKFNAVAGVTYHYSFAISFGSLGLVAFYNGSCPDALNLLFVNGGSLHPLCDAVVWGATETVWIQLSNNGGVPFDWTFNFGSGPCP